MRSRCPAVHCPHVGGRTVLAATMMTLAACGRLGFSPTSNQSDPDAALDAETFAPPPAAFASGTRLRPIRQQVGDVDRLAGWHDMLLDLDCDFMDTPMGLRCMPTAVGSTNLTADPACTVPLAASPGFAVQGCGATPGYIYDVRAKKAFSITPHADTAYIASGGGCAPRSAPELALFDIGPEVAVTLFVGSHEEQTAGREFSYLETVADDGARVRQSTVVNNATGKRCDWLDTNIDERRCVDDAVTGTVAYTDAACSDEVLLTGAVAANIVVQQPTLCDDNPRILEAGAAYSGPLFQRDGSGACVATTSASLAFRPGREHHTDFPAAVRAVGAGTSRVRALVWRTASGEDFEDYYMWDTAVDAKCTPLVDATTKRQVCGPIWTSEIYPVYTEASCSSTARYVLSDCREHGGAVWYPTAEITGTCDGFAFQVVTYVTTGAPGVAFERLPDGTCAPIDVVTNPLRVPNAAVNYDANSAMPVTTTR